MQPAFSLTSLSSHGPDSEPSSFQERRTCYEMLIQRWLLLPPCPGFLEDVWHLGNGNSPSFPCYFPFTSLQLHVVVSLHTSPQHEGSKSFASSSKPTHLSYFSFTSSLVLFPFCFVLLCHMISHELAQDNHFSASFLYWPCTSDHNIIQWFSARGPSILLVDLKGVSEKLTCFR